MKNKPILASAALVAVATVLARFFGFLREVVLAAIYGASAISDAFVISFTAPDILLALVAASVAAAFIPTFTSMTQGKTKLTSNIITLLALIGLAFSLVFAVFPQALTYLFASQLDADTFAMATDLMRIMVWAAVPVLVVRVLQSYLQIQKAFFLAATINIPINIAAIVGIVLSRSVGMTAIMGYGVVAGNVIMLAYMLLVAGRKGYTYHPTLDLRTPELRKLLILMVPILLSTLINDINLIIDRNFASSLASGSISSLNYAARIVSVLTALFGLPVGTVLFPRMAELSAQGNTEGIRTYISSSVKKLGPILIPAVAGVILLAEPLVRIFFERGDFTPEDTRRTAECLMMYAAVFLAASINHMLTRAMFSLHDTKTPAIISALSVAVGIVLKLLLIRPLAHMGLALATSIAGLLTTSLLLLALRKRLGGLKLKSDGWEWVKTLVATTVMGVAVGVGAAYLPLMSGGAIQSVALTGGLILGGAGIYILSHAIMRTVFLRDMTGLVRGLLSRKG